MKNKIMVRLISTVLVLVSLLSVMSVNSFALSNNVHDILFDWEYYYSTYPDLQRAFGRNPSALRNHWESCGKREGRSPSVLFNAPTYLSLYKDLKNAFGNNYKAAYDHFVNHGIAESRKASYTFDVAVYKANYSDLRQAFGGNNLMYLKHYREYGKREGRNAISLIGKTPTPAPSPSNTTTIENGAVYLINFKNTGMGINVQFAPKTGIGNLALDSTSNKENNEKWLFTYNSKYNAYYITPVYRPGAAINALYGAAASKGSQAKLHDSNIVDTASLWRLEKDGNYYRFKNVACGYYLDVAYGKTAAGTRVNLWSKDNSGNQLFTLKKVADAPKSSGWQWPMEGKTITQAFNRYSTKRVQEGKKPYHCGIDMVSSDTRIRAAASGTVIYRGYTSGNGNHIIIQHNVNGQTVKTLYSHLENFNGCPAVNSYVEKGTVIGKMGNTGNSSGPHLHFAVFTGNSNDPLGYTSYGGANKATDGGCTFYNPSKVIETGNLF